MLNNTRFLFSFQYGFVNYALELLVLRKFGEEAWEAIKYVFVAVTDKILISCKLMLKLPTNYGFHELFLF